MSSVSSTVGASRASTWPLIYTGVALTTMATLILELALTRIFSVVFFYHFAFLAISIALFGLGAGGVISYFFRNSFLALGRISAVTALVVVLSIIAITRGSSVPGFWGLALVYFAAAMPFLLAGTVVSAAIAETVDRVDRVYFADLFGAAAGCLLLIPFLNSVGGPGTVLTAAVLYAAASALWFGLARSVLGRTLGVALALALVVLIIFNARAGFIDVKQAKGRPLENEIFVRWNSFSRIAVTEDRDRNRTIVIDGDATTGIARFDFDRLVPNQIRDLTQQGPGFVYAIRPGAKTLIIGPGGGWDVSRALVSGSKDITGVEINPIIASQIMRRDHPEWSNRLYFRPEVRIFVEDGRSFVRASSERYQVIQATLVDTWASTAAGAFALSENNLYTSDAFKDYLTHLTDDGVLSFTRWGFDPPRESLRLLALSIDALGRLGETDFARHFIVIREGGQKALAGWGALDTVLVSRKPFGAADLARAAAAIQAAGYDPVYLPGAPVVNDFGRLLTTADRQTFYRDYPYDVSPVTDDRPFFFYTVQPRDLVNLNPTEGGERADFKVNLAVPTLFQLLGVSALATLVTLVLPPLLLGSRLPQHPGVRYFLLYFVCLGAGYILVQVGLIQRLVLFLGRPTYALTIVIYTMLLSSGLGSFTSKRFAGNGDRPLRRLLLLLAALLAFLALAAAWLVSFGVAWPLWAKVAATVAIIFPAGFLMGVPFPLGLARLQTIHPPSVRWAWSLNAAASVLGSATAIAVAIFAGLRATVLLGALLYLVAWLILKYSRTSRQPVTYP